MKTRYRSGNTYDAECRQPDADGLYNYYTYERNMLGVQEYSLAGTSVILNSHL